MVNSAYIHIPFCKSKCKYCSFVSYPKLELKEHYIKALIKEINKKYMGEPLKTLYFGGGTPSLLTIHEFKTLLELFNYTKSPEITAELNPETLTQDYLNGLKAIGINRISLGCQTFNDDILKIIGRRHTSAQTVSAIKFAKNAGFNNISVDFIYGLPGQTKAMFINDLRYATTFDIQHISLYGLKIDECCYFYSHTPENLGDEDMQAEMYLSALEVLQNFTHYEISNFGKPSIHNLNYWNNRNYYGFGAAAHGYVKNIRYSNPKNLDDYIKNPTKHLIENVLTQQQQLEEEIFLGFRKIIGINVKQINKKFNINFDKKYKKIIEKYHKFIKQTQNGYALNTEGILISNVILSEFLE